MGQYKNQEEAEQEESKSKKRKADTQANNFSMDGENLASLREALQEFVQASFEDIDRWQTKWTTSITEQLKVLCKYVEEFRVAVDYTP